MDRDEAEKRIAELERQLAERSRPTDNPVAGGLTAEQVHNVAFSNPPIGQRGYNEDEVDAFLDLVEVALRDPTGRALTAEQVRSVAFSKPPIGKRGYNEDEVDGFLELVEAQIRSAPGQPPLPGPPAFQPPQTGRSHARDATPDSKGRRLINGIVDIVRRVLDSLSN